MSTRSGFTLIELSIVLVIIGLIVGGVLVGQDLIRAAELRKVVSEIESIRTAINTYRLKYQCIPGDCPNAETFWGSDSSCPTTTPNTTIKQETCNGNGDRKIGDFSGGTVESMKYEYYRFWQQLGNAELIGQQFSGTHAGPTSGDSWNCNGGKNCYKSTTNGSYVPLYIELTTGSSVQFVPAVGNYMLLGNERTTGAIGHPDIAIFSPIDMFSLDTKTDDGKPGLGRIKTYNSSDPETPNCADGTGAATASYRTDLNTVECAAVIELSKGTF